MFVYGGEAYKAPICLFVEPLEAMEGVYWATYGRWAASLEGLLLGLHPALLSRCFVFVLYFREVYPYIASMFRIII